MFSAMTSAGNTSGSRIEEVSMFTGIVTDIGRIEAATRQAGGRRLRIATRYRSASIAIGASIACGGVCLTVVAKSPARATGGWFEVEAWEEALRLTTAGQWETGTRVNLERALRVGEELGGHFVSGHVDGLARIVSVADEGGARRIVLETPAALSRFIAAKGSVALDGVSLTVNKVAGNRFDVLLIAHTLAVTTWGDRKAGDSVNLEVDLLARHVARLAQAGAARSRGVPVRRVR
jgi:riboflavin synthase